jgi:hypothetical protein
MDASSCVVITVAYSINKYLSVCLVLLLIFESLLKQQSCRISAAGLPLVGKSALSS